MAKPVTYKRFDLLWQEIHHLQQIEADQEHMLVRRVLLLYHFIGYNKKN
jgi:hypothetical protein